MWRAAARRCRSQAAGIAWARGGTSELYYVDLDGHLMAVPVETSPELRLGAVTKLFDWVKPPAQVSGRNYDVSPTDGRFLMAKPGVPADASVDVSVTLNWLAEVERLVPTR